MISHLESDLKIFLNNACELYVAVALMNSYGLDFLEDNISPQCSRKYLVGVNLPTHPDVLLRLFEMGGFNDPIFSKIFTLRENYHPKVYIIRGHDRKLTAYVGSANATKGGFKSNVEMGILIHDEQQCNELLYWFDKMFSISGSYDLDYINKYRDVYNRNRLLRSTLRANIDDFLEKNHSDTPRPLNVPTGQFFEQEDFEAFGPTTHYNTDRISVAKRRVVRDKLLKLNDEIHSKFRLYGIDNLYTHPKRNNFTSQHFHSRGNNHIPKEAIWLHYGKSSSELENYEGFYKHFVNHIRIQVILRNVIDEAYIGIWLFVSKINSSYYDRSILKKQIVDPNFSKLLFNFVADLGGAYWIVIGNQSVLFVSDLQDESHLKEYLLKDDYSGQFIIGRNYSPDSADLSKENISETVLVEFSKLYKIYDLIRYHKI